MSSVAVVGDGPAGATLAVLLARAGLRVGLFSAGRPPAPLVGESLVPAVIPILRELGVEDEVRAYGEYKPGATFAFGAAGILPFFFGRERSRLPDYAYNVPRDRFDATLLEVCRHSGVRIFAAPARVERLADDRAAGGLGVRLSDETLAVADGFFGKGAPDWIVDASGRRRLLARLLQLPTRPGDRRDAALFAHCSGVPLDHPGHVHMDRLEHGWCWRIPLPGRVSLGIVVRPEVLRRFGERSEEQFDGFVATEPRLKELTQGAERLSAVARYTNYQLTTLRGVGPGWALTGDSFGFVDPVLSSGLYLAMDGAQRLARAIASGSPAALRRYERHQIRHIDAWRTAVEYFYDGRLFALLRLGADDQSGWVGRIVNSHVSKHVARIFTGEAPARSYSRLLLDVMVRRALDPSEVGGAGDVRIC